MSSTTVVEDLVRASLSPAPPMNAQQILESQATAEALAAGRRGTDPLTKLFLTVPGTSVKCETTRKRLQQTSEVRHSREDLLLHPQDATNASPATERRNSKIKDFIEEQTCVRETSSVAILGKRIQREFRSVFRLPDGMMVAVRREETYSPEEDHMDLRAFLSTACPPNVKYGGGGAHFWRKARKPAAIGDFLKGNELANSLFSYTKPLDVELARVQAAAERDESPLLRRQEHYSLCVETEHVACPDDLPLHGQPNSLALEAAPESDVRVVASSTSQDFAAYPERSRDAEQQPLPGGRGRGDDADERGSDGGFRERGGGRGGGGGGGRRGIGAGRVRDDDIGADSDSSSDLCSNSADSRPSSASSSAYTSSSSRPSGEAQRRVRRQRSFEVHAVVETATEHRRIPYPSPVGEHETAVVTKRPCVEGQRSAPPTRRTSSPTMPGTFHEVPATTPEADEDSSDDESTATNSSSSSSSSSSFSSSTTATEERSTTYSSQEEYRRVAKPSIFDDVAYMDDTDVSSVYSEEVDYPTEATKHFSSAAMFALPPAKSGVPSGPGSRWSHSTGSSFTNVTHDDIGHLSMPSLSGACAFEDNGHRTPVTTEDDATSTSSSSTSRWLSGDEEVMNIGDTEDAAEAFTTSTPTKDINGHSSPLEVPKFKVTYESTLYFSLSSHTNEPDDKSLVAQDVPEITSPRSERSKGTSTSSTSSTASESEESTSSTSSASSSSFSTTSASSSHESPVSRPPIVSHEGIVFTEPCPSIGDVPQQTHSQLATAALRGPPVAPQTPSQLFDRRGSFDAKMESGSDGATRIPRCPVTSHRSSWKKQQETRRREFFGSAAYSPNSSFAEDNETEVTVDATVKISLSPRPSRKLSGREDNEAVQPRHSEGTELRVPSLSNLPERLPSERDSQILEDPDDDPFIEVTAPELKEHRSSLTVTLSTSSRTSSSSSNSSGSDSDSHGADFSPMESDLHTTLAGIPHPSFGHSQFSVPGGHSTEAKLGLERAPMDLPARHSHRSTHGLAPIFESEKLEKDAERLMEEEEVKAKIVDVDTPTVIESPLRAKAAIEVHEPPLVVLSQDDAPKKELKATVPKKEPNVKFGRRQFGARATEAPKTKAPETEVKMKAPKMEVKTEALKMEVKTKAPATEVKAETLKLEVKVEAPKMEVRAKTEEVSKPAKKDKRPIEVSAPTPAAYGRRLFRRSLPDVESEEGDNKEQKMSAPKDEVRRAEEPADDGDAKAETYEVIEPPQKVADEEHNNVEDDLILSLQLTGGRKRRMIKGSRRKRNAGSPTDPAPKPATEHVELVYSERQDTVAADPKATERVERVLSRTPDRVVSPVPKATEHVERVFSRTPDRVASPVPKATEHMERVFSRTPDRVASPVPNATEHVERVFSRTPDRVASPVPKATEHVERVFSRTPDKITSPATTPDSRRRPPPFSLSLRLDASISQYEPVSTESESESSHDSLEETNLDDFEDIPEMAASNESEEDELKVLEASEVKVLEDHAAKKSKSGKSSSSSSDKEQKTAKLGALVEKEKKEKKKRKKERKIKSIPASDDKEKRRLSRPKKESVKQAELAPAAKIQLATEEVPQFESSPADLSPSSEVEEDSVPRRSTENGTTRQSDTFRPSAKERRRPDPADDSLTTNLDNVVPPVKNKDEKLRKVKQPPTVFPKPQMKQKIVDPSKFKKRAMLEHPEVQVIRAEAHSSSSSSSSSDDDEKEPKDTSKSSSQSQPTLGNNEAVVPVTDLDDVPDVAVKQPPPVFPKPQMKQKVVDPSKSRKQAVIELSKEKPIEAELHSSSSSTSSDDEKDHPHYPDHVRKNESFKPQSGKREIVDPDDKKAKPFTEDVRKKARPPQLHSIERSSKAPTEEVSITNLDDFNSPVTPGDHKEKSLEVKQPPKRPQAKQEVTQPSRTTYKPPVATEKKSSSSSSSSSSSEDEKDTKTFTEDVRKRASPPKLHSVERPKAVSKTEPSSVGETREAKVPKVKPSKQTSKPSKKPSEARKKRRSSYSKDEKEHQPFTEDVRKKADPPQRASKEHRKAEPAKRVSMTNLDDVEPRAIADAQKENAPKVKPPPRRTQAEQHGIHPSKPSIIPTEVPKGRSSSSSSSSSSSEDETDTKPLTEDVRKRIAPPQRSSEEHVSVEPVKRVSVTNLDDFIPPVESIDNNEKSLQESERLSIVMSKPVPPRPKVPPPRPPEIRTATQLAGTSSLKPTISQPSVGNADKGSTSSSSSDQAEKKETAVHHVIEDVRNRVKRPSQRLSETNLDNVVPPHKSSSSSLSSEDGPDEWSPVPCDMHERFVPEDIPSPTKSLASQDSREKLIKPDVMHEDPTEDDKRNSLLVTKAFGGPMRDLSSITGMEPGGEEPAEAYSSISSDSEFDTPSLQEEQQPKTMTHTPQKSPYMIDPGSAPAEGYSPISSDSEFDSSSSSDEDALTTSPPKIMEKVGSDLNIYTGPAFIPKPFYEPQYSFTAAYEERVVSPPLEIDTRASPQPYVDPNRFVVDVDPNDSRLRGRAAKRGSGPDTNREVLEESQKKKKKKGLIDRLFGLKGKEKESKKKKKEPTQYDVIAGTSSASDFNTDEEGPQPPEQWAPITIGAPEPALPVDGSERWQPSSFQDDVALRRSSSPFDRRKLSRRVSWDKELRRGPTQPMPTSSDLDLSLTSARAGNQRRISGGEEKNDKKFSSLPRHSLASQSSADEMMVDKQEKGQEAAQGKKRGQEISIPKKPSKPPPKAPSSREEESAAERAPKQRPAVAPELASADRRPSDPQRRSSDGKPRMDGSNRGQSKDGDVEKLEVQAAPRGQRGMVIRSPSNSRNKSPAEDANAAVAAKGQRAREPPSGNRRQLDPRMGRGSDGMLRIDGSNRRQSKEGNGEKPEAVARSQRGMVIRSPGDSRNQHTVADPNAEVSVRGQGALELAGVNRRPSDPEKRRSSDGKPRRDDSNRRQSKEGTIIPATADLEKPEVQAAARGQRGMVIRSPSDSRNKHIVADPTAEVYVKGQGGLEMPRALEGHVSADMRPPGDSWDKRFVADPNAQISTKAQKIPEVKGTSKDYLGKDLSPPKDKHEKPRSPSFLKKTSGLFKRLSGGGKKEEEKDAEEGAIASSAAIKSQHRPPTRHDRYEKENIRGEPLDNMLPDMEVGLASRSEVESRPPGDSWNKRTLADPNAEVSLSGQKGLDMRVSLNGYSGEEMRSPGDSRDKRFVADPNADVVVKRQKIPEIEGTSKDQLGMDMSPPKDKHEKPRSPSFLKKTSGLFKRLSGGGKKEDVEEDTNTYSPIKSDHQVVIEKDMPSHKRKSREPDETVKPPSDALDKHHTRDQKAFSQIKGHAGADVQGKMTFPGAQISAPSGGLLDPRLDAVGIEDESPIAQPGDFWDRPRPSSDRVERDMRTGPRKGLEKKPTRDYDSDEDDSSSDSSEPEESDYLQRVRAHLNAAASPPRAYGYQAYGQPVTGQINHPNFATGFAPRDDFETELPDFLQPPEEGEDVRDSPNVERAEVARNSLGRHAMRLPQRPRHASEGSGGEYEELPPAPEIEVEEAMSVSESARDQFEVPYDPDHEPEEIVRLRRQEAAAAEEERRRHGAVGADGMNRLLVQYAPKTHGHRHSRHSSSGHPGLRQTQSYHSLGRHKVALTVPHSTLERQREKKGTTQSATNLIVRESSGMQQTTPNQQERVNLVDGAMNFMLAVLDGKLPEGMKEEPQENPFCLDEVVVPADNDEVDVAPDRSLKRKALRMSDLKAGRRAQSLGRLSRSRHSLSASKQRLLSTSATSVKAEAERPADRWPSMPLPNPEHYNSLWRLSPERHLHHRRTADRHWPIQPSHYNYITGV